MVKDEVPFEIGQLAETKSFEDGFRGAWFRCKILDIKQKSGDISVQMDYYDYSDQKSIWTKLYQSPPYGKKKKKKKKKELMVRPRFPRVYRRSEKADEIEEGGVLVNDEWKVGDLVDWSTDGCFWSATVTDIISDKRLKIELLPRPEGQGSCYEASSEELRPSLNWCIESGWSVPVPTAGNGSSHPCAQILVPSTKGNQVKRGDGSLPAAGKYEEGSLKQKSYESVGKEGTIKDDDKLNVNNTTTLESAIVELEGLVNKVKRLERLLKFGATTKIRASPTHRE